MIVATYYGGPKDGEIVHPAPPDPARMDPGMAERHMR
jgi:hypothetical protein